MIKTCIWWHDAAKSNGFSALNRMAHYIGLAFGALTIVLILRFHLLQTFYKYIVERGKKNFNRKFELCYGPRVVNDPFCLALWICQKIRTRGINHIPFRPLDICRSDLSSLQTPSPSPLQSTIHRVHLIPSLSNITIPTSILRQVTRYPLPRHPGYPLRYYRPGGCFPIHNPPPPLHTTPRSVFGARGSRRLRSPRRLPPSL